MKIRFFTHTLLLMLPCLAYSQGFKTSGSELKDVNGNTFIMKGVNVPLAWFETDVLSNIKNIKNQSGSNTLRIVIGSGQAPNAAWNTPDAIWQAAVDSTIRNKMIPMIEVHNILGSNDSLHLKAVTDWWISKKDYLTRPDIAKYILINIANEWGDWYMSQPAATAPNQVYWRDAYNTSVKRLRAAGIKTTLVIDAPGYGQDKGATALLTHAPGMINADPEKNLLFGIHTYCEWNTANGARANTVFPQLKNAGIPFFVGEVANTHPDGANTCQIPAEQIMAASVQYNSGYLGWSWKGNGASTAALDIAVNWSGTQLTPWGEILVNSAVGTKSATEASVFGGTSSNKNPVITITSPVNNASMPAPATVTITATATDEDGQIQRVDFYQGATKIGQATEAPYTFTVQALPKGTYTFSAFAVDNDNGAGVSNTVSVSVTSANGNILTNGDFESGSAGWTLQTTAPATGTLTVATNGSMAGQNSLKICPVNPGTEDNNVLAQTTASLTAGQSYEISFLAKADVARSIKVGFQQNGGTWTWITDAVFSLTTVPELYSYSFVASATYPAINIKFLVGLSAGCVEIDNVIFSSGTITGVERVAAGPALSVFPVPFSESLTILYRENFRYELRNNAGQLVEAGSGKEQAELASNLPKGFYILRVTTQSGTSDLKIIKE